AAAAAAASSADAATAAANGIDLTGLSAGLATLQAEVDAVQASLATAATATAVAALQAELDAIEADVEELLSTSNIYSTAITVNSVSTLDSALALGNKLNILNAAATITVSTAMDQTKVQTLVNRIKTMTGDLTFNSSSTTETTFENLTSVAGLYANQKGGYNFKNLVSAGAVQLNDQYEANISVIDFRSLTTVTSFATLTAAEVSSANTIDFNQATELHLTSLARYPGASLTIVTKEGATLAMPVIDDLDNNGTYEATSLTLTGPASFSTSLLTDGTLEFTNVATVSVTDYRGGITVNTGVETFTGTDIVALTVDTGADDLTSLTADFKRDDEPSLSSTAVAALAYDAAAGNNGDLSLTGLANLSSATISGDAGDITISTNPNLTSVTVTANAFDFTMDDNDNLTSVNVTGAKFHDVSITGMADLTSLTLNHTTKLPSTSSTAAEKGAALTVYNNAALTSLTVSADDIDALSVYTNAALETVDFTGLADDGSATSTSAAIYDNNLKVSLFKNGYDTGTAYTSTDTGSITTASGIDTLKTWLDAVIGAASATAGIYVFVDQIDKYEVQSTLNGTYTDTAVPTAPAVTTEATANSNSTSIYAIAAVQAAETSTSGSTVRETQTVVFPISNNAVQAPSSPVTGDGIIINAAGLSKSFVTGASNNGSTVTSVAELVSYIDGDTSWGSELTISAENKGYLRSLQKINYNIGTGAAGSVSAAGNLWFNLGSTVISGTIALSQSDNATAIASKLATKISDTTHPVTGAYLYNATANGAIVEIRNAISKTAAYSDDVTSWAAAIPAISFNVTTDSSTAVLGGVEAKSNVTDNGTANTTSGFFLTVTKNDINGIAVTIKNNNKGVKRLDAAVVSVASVGTSSSIFGAIGQAGTTSVTTASLGAADGLSNGYGDFASPGTADGNNTISAMLVSNTHFVGGQNKTAKVAVFSLISDATTSTTQSAAITDRTGWL
ncbi:MAG: hypothetical protein VW741_02525, partial [Flammeovirgaceae bacterium]